MSSNVIASLFKCKLLAVSKVFLIFTYCHIGWWNWTNYSFVWLTSCRTNPPRFLAESCKRQLNRGSLLCLGCLGLLSSSSSFRCAIYFVGSNRLSRLPPKWPKLCRVGVGNFYPLTRQTTRLWCCWCAEIREVLGARGAAVDSAGQRVPGESDIWAHLSRVWSAKSLLFACQCVSAETSSETCTLSTDYQQWVSYVSVLSSVSLNWNNCRVSTPIVLWKSLIIRLCR